jgi:uncharacterized protein
MATPQNKTQVNKTQKKQNKKFNRTYNNSMVEIAALARLSTLATGSSQLSDYGTISNSNNYALITLNRIILTYFYAGNGIFQRAVQVPVLDAISKGIEIESDEVSNEEIEEVMEWWENNNLWDIILNYYTWTRLYGGGGIVINTDQDPIKPFDIRAINKNTPLDFYDMDRWVFQTTNSAVENVEDVFMSMSNYDKYYIYGQEIHKSRVIISAGKKAPYYVRRQLKGWGLSVAESMIRDLNNYIKTGDVLYEILDESKVDVYYIKDLAQKLLTTGGINNIKNRLQTANEIKSYLNALLMDLSDKYEQKQMSFAGLAEVMNQNRIGIAACLNMPVTKIFGMSASGFNSGEDDLENYNSMVESEIRPKLKPAIKQLLQIGFQYLYGYIPSFKIKFPPLRLLSETDQENVKTSKQNRILQWYDRGILSAPKCVEMAKKEGLVTIEINEAAIPEKPIAPGGEGSVSPISSNPIIDKKQDVKVLRKNILNDVNKIINNKLNMKDVQIIRNNKK